MDISEDGTRNAAARDAEVAPHAEEAPQSYRPALQTIARLIATDRRAVLLANRAGEVLLANTPAKRLGLGEDGLRAALDWEALCTRAARAGSAPVSLPRGAGTLEGELVFLPLGRAAGFLLRLSETDDEATWLRNRARSATLMRVTHDLRTPIQSLLASAEALLRPGPRNETAMKQFRRAADLSMDHISNVLAVIRGEQAASGLQPDEAFSLSDELTALIEVMRPIAEARGATLGLDLPDVGDLRVVGPVRFVRALFQNMIDNSVKYGGERIDVTLRARTLTGGLDAAGPQAPPLAITLEVRDLGGGLPEAQKQRLQQALGQGGFSLPAAGEAGGKSRPSGGLNVLAHALGQLGGQLEVLDRGTDGEAVRAPGAAVAGTILRASFSLPAAEADLAADQPEADLPPEERNNLLAGYRILVVEDSPSSQAWLLHVLRNAGGEVHGVGSGAEALQYLTGPLGQGIALVLSDVTLPRMTGIELAARIRAGQAAGKIAARLAIVGLTAHVDEAIRTACLKAGMARVLEKPIRPQPLCIAALEVLSTADPADPLPAPLKPHSERLARVDALFDPTVSADLIREIGREGGLRFMSRALGEAEAALTTLRGEGITANTGCMLHAATGACGLTGLSAVEKCLRALEDTVARPDPDLGDGLAALSDAMAATDAAIRAWPE